MSNRETLIRLNVGCGLNPAPGYINLDNSPSLIIQKNFLLRALARVAERSGSVCLNSVTRRDKWNHAAVLWAAAGAGSDLA